MCIYRHWLAWEISSQRHPENCETAKSQPVGSQRTVKGVRPMRHRDHPEVKRRHRLTCHRGRRARKTKATCSQNAQAQQNGVCLSGIMESRIGKCDVVFCNSNIVPHWYLYAISNLYGTKDVRWKMGVARWERTSPALRLCPRVSVKPYLCDATRALLQ